MKLRVEMNNKETSEDWFAERMESADFRRAVDQEEFVEILLNSFEEAMQEQGISRTELAKRIGCSIANVSRAMKRTSNLTLRTIFEMSQALDLRVRPVVTCRSSLSHCSYKEFPNLRLLEKPRLEVHESRPWTGTFPGASTPPANDNASAA